MPIDPDTYYGTVELADAYFAERLHETDWLSATPTDKEKALLAATRDIDALSYAGLKNPAFALLAADPTATDAELAEAAATQLLEFPRDGAEEVPDDVLTATYEIAHELLKGRDPGKEFENLVLTSEGVGSTRFSNDRSGGAPPHLANGIVSYAAWRFLLPLLAPNDSFDFRRVS